MVDLNGHEAGNGGHSQGKPTAYRDSSTRREAIFRQLTQEILVSRPLAVPALHSYLCTFVG
jgi:hypothetical protein